MHEVQEMQVRSLGWEDPLDKGMGTQSSISTWRIPWTEKYGGLQSTESQKSWKQLNNKQQWHPTPVLLPGKFHGRRSLEGCSPWGCEESDTTEQLHFPFSLSCIGKGNGNPLQCSCLENPRDGGAWWAAVYGVAQSRTQLTRLSKNNKNMGIKQSTMTLTSFYQSLLGLSKRFSYTECYGGGWHRRFEKSGNPVEE